MVHAETMKPNNLPLVSDLAIVMYNRAAELSAIFCRWKVHIVDVGALHNAVLDVVLELPRIA